MKILLSILFLSVMFCYATPPSWVWMNSIPIAASGGGGWLNGTDYTNGLYAQWKLNDGSSTNVADSGVCGVTHNGIFTNNFPTTINWTNSNSNARSAGWFTGSNWVQCNSLTTLNFNALTMTWWCYWANAYNTDIQKSLWGQSGGSYISGQLYTDGNYYFGSAGSSRVTVAATAANTPLGVWQFNAITEGSGGTSWYTNGVLCSHNAAAITVPNAAVPWVIGNIGGSAGNEIQGNGFRGAMCDFRIYTNNILSTSTLSTLYNNGPQ